MAQTTNGMTFVSAEVHISPDGVAWTDVSGHGASVAVSGGERTTGEQQTFDGDTPIVGAGPRGAVQLTVRYVYTEEEADPFEVLRTQHETEGGPIYVQYSPKSGFWFKTGEAVLVKPGYPGGDSSSGDTVMSEFVVKCAALTKDTASD
jgi:hypothetical protein